MSIESSRLFSIKQFAIDVSIRKRHVTGYTQFDLAEKMNVTPGLIGKVESRKFSSKYKLNHI